MYFVQKCSLPTEFAACKKLIIANNLGYEENVTDVFAIFSNGEAIATASLDNNIIKMVAINEKYQGENLTAKLITQIKTYLFKQNIDKYFLYTKPEQVKYFTDFGFSLIAKTDKVALLENNENDINQTLDKISKEYRLSNKSKAAIVMNCNPMTNGHLYLIEYAAKRHAEVVVFLVEEDRSTVPFDVRLTIVKQTTNDLKNVLVIPSTKYIISQATFPTYFIKETSEKSMIFMELDTLIFKKYFFDRFKIEKRYVGEETIDMMTDKYNETLLKAFGNRVEIVKRLKYNNEPISASLARKYAQEKNFAELKKIVPLASYHYLLSKYGENNAK
ncbi:MAG: hypothetical protein WC964_02005 [Acholeplasmataceae bacterium]